MGWTTGSGRDRAGAEGRAMVVLGAVNFGTIASVCGKWHVALSVGCRALFKGKSGPLGARKKGIVSRALNNFSKLRREPQNLLFRPEGNALN